MTNKYVKGSHNHLNKLEEIQEQLKIETDRITLTSLAKKALSIDSNCVQALTVLGDESILPGEALKFYDRAIEIARQSISKQIVPYLYGGVYNKPKFQRYLMLKYTHAWCLWKGMNKKEEALYEYYELMEMCKSDPMGVRFYVVPILLELGRFEELASLLDRFKGDQSATWLYTKSLLNYLKLFQILKNDPNIPNIDTNENNKKIKKQQNNKTKRKNQNEKKREKGKEKNNEKGIEINKNESKKTKFKMENISENVNRNNLNIIAFFAFKIITLEFIKSPLKKKYLKFANLANESLKKAMKINSIIPLYLLGKKKLTNYIYERDYLIGSKKEAIIYTWYNLKFWKQIIGSLQWINFFYQHFLSKKRISIKNSLFLNDNVDIEIEKNTTENEKEIQNKNENRKKNENENENQNENEKNQNGNQNIKEIKTETNQKNKKGPEQSQDVKENIDQNGNFKKQQIIIKMKETDQDNFLNQKQNQNQKIDNFQKKLGNFFDEDNIPELVNLNEFRIENNQILFYNNNKNNNIISKKISNQETWKQKCLIKPKYSNEDYSGFEKNYQNEETLFKLMDRKKKVKKSKNNRQQNTIIKRRKPSKKMIEKIEEICSLKKKRSKNERIEMEYKMLKEILIQKEYNQNFVNYKNHKNEHNRSNVNFKYNANPYSDSNSNPDVYNSNSNSHDNNSNVNNSNSNSDGYDSNSNSGDDDNNPENKFLIMNQIEFEIKLQRKLNEAKNQKEKGNNCFRNQDYKRAIEYYTHAINLSPKQFKEELSIYYSNRAACFIQLQKFDLVISDCNKSLKYNQKNIKSVFRRSKALIAQKNFQEGIKDLNFILLHNKNNTDALELLKMVQKENTMLNNNSVNNNHSNNGDNKSNDNNNDSSNNDNKNNNDKLNEKFVINDHRVKSQNEIIKKNVNWDLINSDYLKILSFWKSNSSLPQAQQILTIPDVILKRFIEKNCKEESKQMIEILEKIKLKKGKNQKKKKKKKKKNRKHINLILKELNNFNFFHLLERVTVDPNQSNNKNQKNNHNSKKKNLRNLIPLSSYIASINKPNNNNGDDNNNNNNNNINDNNKENKSQFNNNNNNNFKNKSKNNTNNNNNDNNDNNNNDESDNNNSNNNNNNNNNNKDNNNDKENNDYNNNEDENKYNLTFSKIIFEKEIKRKIITYIQQFINFGLNLTIEQQLKTKIQTPIRKKQDFLDKEFIKIINNKMTNEEFEFRQHKRKLEVLICKLFYWSLEDFYRYSYSMKEYDIFTVPSHRWARQKNRELNLVLNGITCRLNSQKQKRIKFLKNSYEKNKQINQQQKEKIKFIREKIKEKELELAKIKENIKELEVKKKKKKIEEEIIIENEIEIEKKIEEIKEKEIEIERKIKKEKGKKGRGKLPERVKRGGKQNGRGNDKKKLEKSSTKNQKSGKSKGNGNMKKNNEIEKKKERKADLSNKKEKEEDLTNKKEKESGEEKEREREREREIANRIQKNRKRIKNKKQNRKTKDGNEKNKELKNKSTKEKNKDLKNKLEQEKKKNKQNENKNMIKKEKTKEKEKDKEKDQDKEKEKSQTKIITNNRTIWIGNVGQNFTKKKLQKIFYKYGKVNSIRIIRETCCAFINYQEGKSTLKAFDEVYGKMINGMFFGRMNIASQYEKPLSAKQIFFQKTQEFLSNFSYGTVLRMRGIPFSTTKREIKNFFEGFKILKNGISIITIGDRVSGDAFVAFENQKIAKMALKQKNHLYMDWRYIELSLAYTKNSHELKKSQTSDKNNKLIQQDKEKGIKKKIIDNDNDNKGDQKQNLKNEKKGKLQKKKKVKIKRKSK
ncbi:import receptor subunit tom70 [Anaeramoeba flamelloides]|uniref:Import receptor subunit tom70 n=1 Tax=Anaeramoeba flamelloides TaxID=1746091 RepID=A0ABQ8YPW0_9EUKA|nr:import receptor subunit tom70 [Anaeramoeba flamelloides]